MWSPETSMTPFSLEEGATTIMLRSLPASTTLRSLLQILQPLGRGVYDFAYLPRCTRQRHRIVELAFLNFVDPNVAQAAVRFLHNFSLSEASWARTRLNQARLQGLPNNLAYYYLRFGPDAAQEGPDAPAVFAAGVRVPLRWALAQLVSAQALEAAQRLLDSERTGRVEANIEMLEMGGQEGQGGQGGPPGPEAPSTQSWWSSAAAARWRWTLPSITTPDMYFVEHWVVEDTEHLLRLVHEHERRHGLVIFLL
ncbi:unnamed protein product [Symbiodinium natans]|uniref:RRM domain-containing protein n=1 Tax=Symbiodinium natans TaxID=878477 RepID=A0A812KMK3_9DINO|nr:unnamed protein product [Symbiodinium natans]